MNLQEDMRSAQFFIDTGTGTLKERTEIETKLCLHLRDDKKSLEDGHAVVVRVEALRTDSYKRGLTPECPIPNVLPLRGKPINPKPSIQREEFELLMMVVIGCRFGDGTLTVTQRGSKYANEHVQYMWELFQKKMRDTQ